MQQQVDKPDFLLVVDFGYIVPDWLLQIPKIAPLNIHPSELPKWRGSSPGQFSILFNDKKSAVTLMIMDKKLDHGPIIHQDFFEVDQNWTQTEYYEHAFKLICNKLDEKINKFGREVAKEADSEKLNFAKKNKTEITECGINKNKYFKIQPDNSPTITAKMLKKDQTFVSWNIVKLAMNGENTQLQLSPLLTTALEHNHSLALTLERASKAFSPWPNLWTIIPTQKGDKRMKLLDLELKLEKLILKTVQIEGKTAGLWSELKNIVKN